MAFPTVAATTSGGAGSGTSALSLTLPSGGGAGDLVVLLVVANQISITIAATGWTQTLSDTQSSTTIAVLSRKLDGSEGSSISISRPTACSMSYVGYRYASGDWHGTTMPEAADVWSTSNADPPSLSPSWGADDTQWIAGLGWRLSANPMSAYPTNYANDQVLAGTVNGNGVYGRAAFATRNLNASSEDPGAYTNNGNAAFGITIAVRPAAAGGTNYTLTGDTGTFAITGEAAALKASRVIAGAAGSFGITGQSAALTASRRIAGAAGSFAISGQAGALRAHRRMAPSAGSFAITGQAAALLASRKLAAQYGAFAITGVDADLTVSSPNTITGETGHFAITGQAARLIVHRRLAASPGSFAVTGEPAGVRHNRRLTGAAGTFALTGVAGALRASRLITGAPGSIVLTGIDADLVKHGVGSRVLTGETGLFAITGGVAELVISKRGPAGGAHALIHRQSSRGSQGQAGSRPPNVQTSRRC